MNINAKLEGMDELMEAVEAVKQKAEELQEAIQRVNEAEIAIEFKVVKKPIELTIDSKKVAEVTHESNRDTLQANQEK